MLVEISKLWESSIRPLAELLKIVLSIFNVAMPILGQNQNQKIVAVQ
jgi:hypothetical protein